MKTTLKNTLILAEDSVITNHDTIITICQCVLSVNITELESVSDYLNFVRTLKFEGQAYQDDPEAFINHFDLYDVINIPDNFRDEGEDRIRCRYFRNILFCMLASNSIKEVRMFNYVSLLKFISLHCSNSYERQKLIKDISNCMNITIDKKTSMRDFFQSARNVFLSSWNIYDDIEMLEKNIMECSRLLDIIFFKYLTQNHF